MLKNAALIVLGLMLLHSPASAKVYQWTDEKGDVVFSSEPPPVRAVAAAPTADQSRARSFPVPERGNLILSVPESWDHEVKRDFKGLPLTIVLAPREGDDFEVLISPLWDPTNRPGFGDAKVARLFIDKDLARMLPTAVERDVQIKEIKGPSAQGYHFFVTDKAPGESYPYAVRAWVGVGDLLLSVTILSRSKDSEGIRQTLLALQGAVHQKG